MQNSDRVGSPIFRPLHWVPEFVGIGRRRMRSQGRLLAASVVVGIVAGLGAVLFNVACSVVVHYTLDSVAGYRAATPAGEVSPSWLPDTDHPFKPWMLLVLPAIGGVISGWLVFTFAPEAEGHGTDAVIEAYHLKQGQIRPRVPLIKLVASALTIGTGGSGGREGPIAQIGAGFGSLLANVLRFGPAERRVLLAAGMGSGIAAIFRAPLAGALFAGEVLYWSPEFEPEVLIPAGVASVISYCTFGAFYGWKTLFTTPSLTFDNPLQLIPYLLLAVLMALLAMLYTRTFYGITALFHKMPIPRTFKPVIGAALSGAIGVGLFYALGEKQIVLSVMAFGYGILQQGFSYVPGAGVALTGAILLAVAVGKILTTSLTIGSGGSGGVFGPSMVIGGCGGGALGLLLNHYWPSVAPQPAAFMIMGMAGFFAAAAKTPLSTLIIVSEMTGSYQLLLPAIWVCAISFLLSDEQSLYRSQVEGRAASPAHQGAYVRKVLAGLHIASFLRDTAAPPVLKDSDPLAQVLDCLARSPYQVVPVVDGDRTLLGIVTLEEAHLASQMRDMSSLVVAADLMRVNVRPLTPDDTLDRALEAFVEAELLALPVVATGGKRLVGVVGRSEVSRTYLRHVQGVISAPVLTPLKTGAH